MRRDDLMGLPRGRSLTGSTAVSGRWAMFVPLILLLVAAVAGAVFLAGRGSAPPSPPAKASPADAPVAEARQAAAAARTAATAAAAAAAARISSVREAGDPQPQPVAKAKARPAG
jgi:hypothetical protein